MPRSNLSSETSTVKKKFGKNLNKLTKPPAPPIPTTGRAASGSSRNGLLLLSTKRSSSTSGMLASKSTTTTASAGATSVEKLSSNPNPVSSRPLGVTTESYTSAHDALLGAVIGASRNADPQQPPDAWGVANESKSPPPASAEPTETSNKMLAPNGKIPSQQQPAQQQPLTVSETTETQNDAHQGVRMSQLARERAEARRLEEEARFAQQKERANVRLKDLEEKMGSQQTTTTPAPAVQWNRESMNGRSYERPLPPGTLYNPYEPQQQGGDKDDNDQFADPVEPPVVLAAEPPPPEPAYQMVNLSRTAEDRDRGESRRDNSAPRMLFDPKSGSMVAVGAREKKSNATAKKPKGGGRNGKERSGSNDLDQKKKKGRKETRKEEDSYQNNKNGGSRGKTRSEHRLPRTCGVLYTRDKNNNIICADGCDGDQGYGCHSVPGGPVRNPEAYNQFLHAQDFSRTTTGYEPYNMNRGDGTTTMNGSNAAVGHQTQAAAPALDSTADWVKPNEKIELVTGAADSPTLQATASAWTPSEAALAAAIAVKGYHSEDMSPRRVATEDEEDEEDINEDELPSFIGLGFDPTENMDSVMRSPSIPANSPAKFGADDLAALSLDTTRTGDATSRNLFAFGSSGTWGEADAGTTQDASSWSMMLGSGNGSTENPKKDGQESSIATSFLSLSSSNNPWGTGGLSGLGGSAIAHGHSADHGDSATAG